MSDGPILHSNFPRLPSWPNGSSSARATASHIFRLISRTQWIFYFQSRSKANWFPSHLKTTERVHGCPAASHGSQLMTLRHRSPLSHPRERIWVLLSQISLDPAEPHSFKTTNLADNRLLPRIWLVRTT